MTTIRQKAQNVNTEKKTEIKNVADLVTLNVDTDIITKVFAEGTDKEFKVDGFYQGEIFYRVPYTVIKQINLLLQDDPSIKIVKIKKSGVGLDTMYMVTPM